MLTHYLQQANEILSNLIETTRNDIEDIKGAKHDNIFSRTKTKEELVKSFENHKSLIDNEIAKMAQASDGASLDTILDDNQQALLDEMREQLQALQKENKHFASMVIAVSEFYSSLINRLIPTEQVGYDSHKAKRASYLHIKG
jgi:uncharacterized membrane-anchored protein YjiN (DUF445 family)